MQMKRKTTGFWISLGGAVVLIIQAIGNFCGFKIDSELVNQLITSVCGFLVVVGILVPGDYKVDLTGLSQDDNMENTTKNDNNIKDMGDNPHINDCDQSNDNNQEVDQVDQSNNKK